MKLWIVGKRCEDDWEFQGVFSEEQLARDACPDEDFFIGPAVLNEVLPSESTEWPGAYYPLVDGKAGL